MKAGDKIYVQNRSLKVMAIVDGWLMLRWKGAMPFLKHQNDFDKFIEKMDKLYQAKDERNNQKSKQ